MTLTIEDIARLSNVSRSTVSRVINGDKKVNEETRGRVLSVIQQNNYEPNIAARRLAAGRTNIIGLVIPVGGDTIFSDPYFSRLIHGVSMACNSREFSVMLWLADPEVGRQMISKIVNNGMLDGVIISSTLLDDPIITTLSHSSMPFVMIGHHPTLSLNYIDIDNQTSAFQITSHLLSCSRVRTRPATITGPRNTMAGLERYNGFVRALEENGLPCDPSLVFEGDFSEETGYRGMQQLLASKPDSVFAANDRMAAGAYQAIKEAGLNIPNDISVAGFDDISLASQLDPPLTTIKQPIQSLGTRAVETLIHVIQQSGNSPIQLLLQPELVIRNSCGCIFQKN